MGSHEIGPGQAAESAIRLVKEGQVHAVKIEGREELAPAVQRIGQAGIPVVGHVGLTPQRQNVLGGFKVQGKSSASALKILRDAEALQGAGATMLVLEAIPLEVPSVITRRLDIPTIGIGSGNDCSGQVLVQADMAGAFPPDRLAPKSVKRYADAWGEALRGITQYRDEVKSRAFPAAKHTYSISSEEIAAFHRAINEANTSSFK